MAEENLKIRDFTVNRKINIMRVENIVKEKCPLDRPKVLSFIEYETGLVQKKANSILMILYDIGKIKIEKDIVYYIGEKKDVEPHTEKKV